MGKRRRLWARWVIGGIAALLVLGVALSGWLANGLVRRRVEATLTRRWQRGVRIGHLSLSISPPSLRATNVAIAAAPAFGGEPLAQLPVVWVRLRFWPLLIGHIEASSIELLRPRIRILQNGQGKWNISGATGRSRAGGRRTRRGRVAAGKVSVEQAQVVIAAAGDARSAVRVACNLSARNVRLDRSFPISVAATMAGGVIRAAGDVGPLRSPQTPAALRIAATRLPAEELIRLARIVGYRPTGFRIRAGTVGFTARLAGRLNMPVVVARVSARDVHLTGLRLPGAGPMAQLGLSGGTGKVKVARLNAELDYHPGRIRLKRLFAETSFGTLRAHGQLRINGPLAFVVGIHPRVQPHHHGIAGLIGSAVRLFAKAKHPNIELQITGTTQHPAVESVARRF